jgi:PKD repeat protein
MFKHNEATIVVMPRRYDIFLALPLLLAGCAIASEPRVDTSPIADFNASIVEGCTPLHVTFTNLSTGQVTDWKWNFGDGHSSTDKAPNHTYNESGIYTVSLLVTGPDGSDETTRIDYIQVRSEIIGWQDAARYIGQVKTVEGIIVEAYFAPGLKGKPTFLNFHKQYQSHFKCIIWYSDRISFLRAFPLNPETHLLNKSIRVTGMIEDYPEGSGVPEIILKMPSQIQVIGE